MLGRRVCRASRLPRKQFIPCLTLTTSTATHYPSSSPRSFTRTWVSSLPLPLNIKAVPAPASLFISRSSPFRVSGPLYSNMSLRRSKSSTGAKGQANGTLTNGSTSLHEEHKHSNGDAHSHSHSMFSHSHGEEGHIEGHEKLMEALRGDGK